MSMRTALTQSPLAGTPAARRAEQFARRVRFSGSRDYWERRYTAGRDSGAGSYGQVAQFKAGFLNDFVRQHQIGSVIEFGCGDGHQLSMSDYPRYVGLDVAPTAVNICSRRFAGDPSKSFLLYDPAHFHNNGALTADLALSLDVLYHLVEDELFLLHLEHLFGAASRYVAVFTVDSDEPTPAAHVRHRRVDEWASFVSDTWALTEKVSSPVKGADSEADFFLFERRPR